MQLPIPADAGPVLVVTGSRACGAGGPERLVATDAGGHVLGGVARARLTRPSLPAGGEPAPPRGMRRVGAGMTVAAAGRPAERWAELGAEAVLGCLGRRTAATRVSGCFAPRGGSVMGRRGVAFN
ncbi:hypothetical_protein (plasmid) [Leishmania braziliensis MHOM/BR/75/M2904]|uniref:Hypothetical_protein n=1 Tax=Leishmania braziliensis MHOM/BR/75/M2904 TaxID=420245 RepID=A0A3P3Z7J6_LEIBR|nr:unnamed protein product [Leishmania braziliensis]SYZ66112.1 hypothetical_protein [Leishmania braziliensis MHOM/BR/75/M2904]